MVMELSDKETKEYFSPVDFAIGKTIQIYNRQFFLYDCDNFTRAYYWKHFGKTDFEPITVDRKGNVIPQEVSTTFVFLLVIIKIKWNILCLLALILLTLQKQVLMYYGSRTLHKIRSGQPANAVAYAVSGRRSDAACALIRWQLFSAWNDVMATILKVWRQIEHPTQLIEVYLLEEIPTNFLPIRFEMMESWVFWRVSPQQEQQQQQQQQEWVAIFVYQFLIKQQLFCFVS